MSFSRLDQHSNFSFVCARWARDDAPALSPSETFIAHALSMSGLYSPRRAAELHMARWRSARCAALT